MDLDNITEIKEIDKSGMATLLHGFSEQCQQGIILGQGAEVPFKKGAIKNIIITGLGGSGIGGDLLRISSVNQLSIPLYINRGYHLPGFAGEESLVFVVSYSGNTEETISTLQGAIKAGCQIVIISSNGLLEKVAQEKSFPLLRIPKGYPPRTALGYLFFPIRKSIEKLGYIPEQKGAEEETISLLQDLARQYSLEQPLSSNPAKQLAQRLFNKIPVVYGTLDNTDIVAYRWKCQFNENAKAYAAYHVFPELNHNEIVGWERADAIAKQFVVIIFRDKGDPARIKQRIDITARMLSDKVDQVIQLDSQGDSLLSRIFSLIYLGDYVSYYLAILREIDPTPVQSINYLKSELSK